MGDMIEIGGYYLPRNTYKALERYMIGIETGGFLYAVLSNDLFGAMGRADSLNSQYIAGICQWIYNRMPASSWGSKEKVEKWLRSGWEDYLKFIKEVKHED